MNKILATMVFIAILPLPYMYYEILRVVVCLGIIFMLISSWANLEGLTKAILIVIALLFNPFSPIYLSKMVWVVIDLVVGFYMLNLNLERGDK